MRQGWVEGKERHFLDPYHWCSITIHLQQQDDVNNTSLYPMVYVQKDMPSSDIIHVYGHPIGKLSLLNRHLEAILKCKDKVTSA